MKSKLKQVKGRKYRKASAKISEVEKQTNNISKSWLFVKINKLDNC